VLRADLHTAQPAPSALSVLGVNLNPAEAAMYSATSATVRGCDRRRGITDRSA
jgi:hypothetical protein